MVSPESPGWDGRFAIGPAGERPAARAGFQVALGQPYDSFDYARTRNLPLQVGCPQPLDYDKPLMRDAHGQRFIR